MGIKPPPALEPRLPESPESEKRPAETRPGLRPEIDLDRAGPSKNYWWVWLIVFGVIAYGCYRLYDYETVKKAAMAAKKGGMMRQRNIPVVTAAARRGDMPVYLQGIGTVTAFNTVTVKTRIDGQLISVNFKEGQLVKQGDVLAEIDPRPYQVALQTAESSLGQANGNFARDQASLRDAVVNLERNQELYRQQIIAKQVLDTQAATADQFRGAIAADQAAIAAAQSAIDSAKLNLTYTRITAPISGRIGLRLVDAGNMVHAADATGLAVITQLQPISVLFNLPEDQLRPVLRKLHEDAKLATEAYDRTQRTKLAEGTLLTVDNQIDTTTGTSRLKAVFPNNDSALFPNQFVNVRLLLDTKRNAIIIPAVAIQRGPTGTFVYVVDDQGTVSVKSVKVGLTEGTNVSIDDGLEVGDNVVVDGAEKLTEGMKVTTRLPNAADQPAGQNRSPDNPAGRRRRKE
jgi:multidrug efflux system membrane fusion protein